MQSLSPEYQKKISIELNNKQYELFMKSLIENCKRRNMPLQSIPEINGKKVNLFILFMLVQRLGGGEQVSRNQQWELLAQKLQVQDSRQLAAVYYRVVLPYEKYLSSPEGLKESQAKKIFFQQFFQELIRKIQANPKSDNGPTISSQASTPSSVATPTYVNVMQQQAAMQGQQRVGTAPKPKKPRKPRQKKKTKKELELEKKQQEDYLRKQQHALLEQQQRQKLLMEQQLQRQKEIIKQQYQQELAKLPKVYKKTSARNYKPVERPVQLTNGYDINYLSQIGEKIDANKPIFLFPPELGVINLHALTMSLQSNDLSEINTALNTLLVTSADSMLKVSLEKYPDLLDSVCILGIKLLNDLTSLRPNQSKKKNLVLSPLPEDSASSSKQSDDILQSNRDVTLSVAQQSGYCEEYDVNAYLSKSELSYSQTDQRMSKILESHIRRLGPDDKTQNGDHSILVDALTGEDIQQSKGLSMTPAHSPEIQNADISKDDFVYQEGPSHSWDILPPPASAIPGQRLENLFVPSYLESLKNVNREVNTPFTKVNTRGAEDKNVLITDQLSTISMVLRNISFSEKNSKLMARNAFLKRFFSDLLWTIFLNHQKLVFKRKALNFKKDTLVTMTNISHAYETENSLDCFLLLMLILSFGESRRTGLSSSKSALTYTEIPLNVGHYSGFSVDIFAKLLSLNRSKKHFFKDILLSSALQTEDSSEKKNKEVVNHLVRLYCDDDKLKLFNDTVSFLISVIPFTQIKAAPTLVEEVAPVISQSLTSLLTLLNFLTKDMASPGSGYERLPFIWLNSEENIGSSLRMLSDVLLNISIHTDKNLLHHKRLFTSISAKSIELTRLLIEKSIELTPSSEAERIEVCEALASIPGLLPSEPQTFPILTSPATDPEVSKQSKLLLFARNRVFSHLVEKSSTKPS